jgi:hypothetical protein
VNGGGIPYPLQINCCTIGNDVLVYIVYPICEVWDVDFLLRLIEGCFEQLDLVYTGTTTTSGKEVTISSSVSSRFGTLDLNLIQETIWTLTHRINQRLRPPAQGVKSKMLCILRVPLKVGRKVFIHMLSSLAEGVRAANKEDE